MRGNVHRTIMQKTDVYTGGCNVTRGSSGFIKAECPYEDKDKVTCIESIPGYNFTVNKKYEVYRGYGTYSNLTPGIYDDNGKLNQYDLWDYFVSDDELPIYKKKMRKEKLEKLNESNL